MTTLGTVYTAILGYFTDMSSTLLSTELFLIPVAVFIIGACIGLVHRIIR